MSTSRWRLGGRAVPSGVSITLIAFVVVDSVPITRAPSAIPDFGCVHGGYASVKALSLRLPLRSACSLDRNRATQCLYGGARGALAADPQANFSVHWFVGMGKYYCDYCDVFLVSESSGHDKAQSYIDEFTRC
ncbi:uncharacterized protein PGTG_10637 [Puccinia graminis f. sp. tritici CRL 75-36-700-3]|uniref:U1-C C2H2-type zinc finger domain-containing protein n=1 Tax=Puccinia graminis f. sp. tritici (strain CRL 75-36-700-3 / race SCCL) TaxID=418459 RepID=E3KIY4_PUCGT|nr:uncharacterized protein PGTG_10637 [Puccinia graminis f. sp. tritici CRL 75-36-700-3]EFP84259.1 hypothetical protein PGTG_10637 [Puccinia graminis f. sp. tritici CRL 75-36-700-3]